MAALAAFTCCNGLVEYLWEKLLNHNADKLTIWPFKESVCWTLIWAVQCLETTGGSPLPCNKLVIHVTPFPEEFGFLRKSMCMPWFGQATFSIRHCLLLRTLATLGGECLSRVSSYRLPGFSVSINIYKTFPLDLHCFLTEKFYITILSRKQYYLL